MVDYPNWFAVTGQGNFEKFLSRYANQDNLRFLQLGAFTGDASVWLCENILTRESCLLTDVDTWRGSEGVSDYLTMDMEDVFAVYQEKVRPFSQRVNSVRSNSVDFLQDYDRNEEFDFIYVDADHTAMGVILDGELGWQRLKVGGILAFDDYTWGLEKPMHERPQLGIDFFLLRHQEELTLLAKNAQLWITKTR